MNLFKRGFLYVKRNLPQSISLFFVIFLLGLLIYGVTSIDRAINQTEESLWRQLPAIVRIEEDWLANELYWQEHEIWPAPPITRELIEELSELPYVRAVDISINNFLYSRQMKQVPDVNVGAASLSSLGVHNIEVFPIKGVNRNNFTELNNGVIELSLGSTFSDAHINDSVPVAIVSSSFAATNNLTIGSTMELASVFMARRLEMFSEHYAEANITDYLAKEFEIIGIFEVNVAAEEIGIDLYNRIYIPYILLESMVNFNREAVIEYFSLDPDEVAEFVVLENFIELYDPRDLATFRQAAFEILPEFITVRDLSDSLDDVIVAMENIRGASSVIFFLIILASILILSLVISLLLRGRKQEIATYLALGERKKKIIFQFTMEIICLTIMAISLSTFVGALASNQMAHWLLVNEMAQMDSQDRQTFDGILLGPNDIVLNGMIFIGEPQEIDLLRPSLTAEAMLEWFDISLKSSDILIFYSVAIATVMISTMIPTLLIMRLEPKKILL